MWTALKYYRIFDTVLYGQINFNHQPVFSYFLLVNRLYNWISLNYKKRYFRHTQKFKRYLYLRLFHAFSFMKSLIRTIKYVFSFLCSLNWSLVCNLYFAVWFILDLWAVFTFTICIHKKSPISILEIFCRFIL